MITSPETNTRADKAVTTETCRRWRLARWYGDRLR